MSTTGPDQAAAIAQRARGRQLAPPTDPTTGQPAAAPKASAAPAASSSTPAPPANSSKPAAPSTSTSKATKSAPRARQYRTNAGPPVHEIPAKPDRARGIKLPTVPEQVTSTAARGGGIMLGLVAYSIGINYLRNGWPGVKQWFAAKFLNQTTSGPGKANIISPNAPITAPSGGTVSV